MIRGHRGYTDIARFVQLDDFLGELLIQLDVILPPQFFLSSIGFIPHDIMQQGPEDYN